MDFKTELIKLNINPTDAILDKFEKYYDRLVTVNEYMNLTAITEHDEVYNKHLLDSLLITKAIDNNMKIFIVTSLMALYVRPELLN